MATRNLFVGNLELDMTEEELKLVFTVSFFYDVLKVFCEFKYLR